MKVALESGEVLEVAILDGERVVGTLSLQMKGVGSSSRVGRPAGAPKAAAASDGATRRRKRKPMSAETRAKMAEAQRRRWGNREEGNPEGSSES